MKQSESESLRKVLKTGALAEHSFGIKIVLIGEDHASVEGKCRYQFAVPEATHLLGFIRADVDCWIKGEV